MHRQVEYVHQDLNQQITAIGGHYVLAKEVRLPFHGREILYLVGHAAFDTTCCGPGGCAYALVPGFVASWHSSQTEDGLAVSRLEPIPARPKMASPYPGLNRSARQTSRTTSGG
jgi:hypothetical protein